MSIIYDVILHPIYIALH